jgi:pSer/pThr/pTyr-binding forkhead associated (FHA) protein
VSYTDPDGAATELREGKFFVTASSLKDSDLIIDEPSISTPHALVSVSTDGGLQVQDLMSDRGVFVRRRGDDTYRREPDVTRVEHGDWLRFGDVEYLVSLIAHVGVK